MQDYQISPETLVSLAELFKVFGDPTRVRILYTLFQEENAYRILRIPWA